MSETKKLDQLSVDTLRMLAVDMVERAKSGHPGMPLGAAPMAHVLWTKFLKHNPADPGWPNRDRFIFSPGHGSALLYGLLHLFGYGLTIDDLKNFRQWESRTPGHPEYGLTPGVEATTGCLGQGFAMGVGMAMAELFSADRFNRDGFDLVDHYTYGIVSDGDLMEGVSAEAASLAGSLALGKLIYLYDDNGISIEGPTSLSFTEDVSRRFQAYGWQVIRVSDGNNLEMIETAIANAREELERPTLIVVRTCIGYGSPKQDSAACHGEPLGADAAAETRRFYGLPEQPFHVPDSVRRHFETAAQAGARSQEQWRELFESYRTRHPELAGRYERERAGRLPEGWEEALPDLTTETAPLATRSASGKTLNALAGKIENLFGGSADLAPSNKTLLDGYPDFGSGRRGGRNIRFGVREHAMAAICNGLALSGGVRPYCGTFLIFSDYMRPAVRMAALMGLNVTYVFTHDSIGVGEDGPTHQPIEQLAALRVIPDLTVLRPADAVETAEAWRLALETDGPVCLALTRQKVPPLGVSAETARRGMNQGAYVVRDADHPQVVIVATGSEVHLAVEAHELLAQSGVPARVVSMPGREIFLRQPEDYQDRILPPTLDKRLIVEAGSATGWNRLAGPGGGTLTIDRFGQSAPGPEVMRRLGFTAENVAERAKALL